MHVGDHWPKQTNVRNKELNSTFATNVAFRGSAPSSVLPGYQVTFNRDLCNILYNIIMTYVLSHVFA